MAHLDPTERWGFGVCFLIGLRQAKDRGGRPPWPQEQYLPLGLCCPSPWLVDLIFPEVCGLSQNGSTSYLRHTCVIPLTQFWAERVFWGPGLWTPFSQKCAGCPKMALRHTCVIPLIPFWAEWAFLATGPSRL